MHHAATTWRDLGARVADARKSAQLSQAELASAVRLDRTAITKVESGERKLDSLELARIARVLRRSIDWFLSAPLPAVVSRRERRGPAVESRADSVLDQLARDTQLLVGLGLLVPPEPPSLPTVESVETAEAAARALRSTLGLPPGPVWDLLPIAERVGCYGYSLDLKDESLDGAYLRLPSGGVAVVNGSNQPGRRRFTLVHELGHHLFADASSDEWIVGTDGDDRERLINAFVIHFLMPREACLPRWLGLDGPRDPHGAAITLGAEFGLSWTAVLGHLRNLQVLDGPTQERLAAQRPTRADYLESGVTLREELSAPGLSPRFSQAVIRAFKRHKISGARALELLRGTVAANDLPAADKIPRESTVADYDLA